MGQLYGFLGLTTGIIQHDQPPDVRRAQYDCDITYGMNSEFGFDYLRDNGMATSKEQQVQRGHYFAIVDEVDSILIDEARTPLIISGPATVSTHQFDKYKPLVEQLVKKQTMLCNRLASEAEDAWKQGKTEEFGPDDVQGEARPAAQQGAAARDGGSREAPRDRQDGAQPSTATRARRSCSRSRKSSSSPSMSARMRPT